MRRRTKAGTWSSEQETENEGRNTEPGDRSPELIRSLNAGSENRDRDRDRRQKGTNKIPVENK